MTVFSNMEYYDEQNGASLLKYDASSKELIVTNKEPFDYGDELNDRYCELFWSRSVSIMLMILFAPKSMESLKTKKLGSQYCFLFMVEIIKKIIVWNFKKQIIRPRCCGFAAPRVVLTIFCKNILTWYIYIYIIDIGVL